MSTSAIVLVYNEQDHLICNIYVHWDGYFKGGLGDAIVEFSRDMRWVNGIPLNETNVFNGMGDYAARLVHFLKDLYGLVGNVYLVSQEELDEADVDHTYVIEFNEPGKPVVIYFDGAKVNLAE